MESLPNGKQSYLDDTEVGKTLTHRSSENRNVKVERDAAVLRMVGVLVDEEDMALMTVGVASDEMDLENQLLIAALAMRTVRLRMPEQCPSASNEPR